MAVILPRYPVEFDGQIITANGPAAGEAFTEAILEKLKTKN